MYDFVVVEIGRNDIFDEENNTKSDVMVNVKQKFHRK